jgi:LAO/AO transport system kinase
MIVADGVLSGEPRAISRAISLLEDGDPDGTRLLQAVFARTGRAFVVGVTGPPGAGKSTLVDRLIGGWRQQGLTVGVLAVDPSSPFTGGALLGDRLRMQAHAADAGVFVRSMATRGHLGGLARATIEAALVLDAAGFDVVVIETVGVGQAEVDIARSADVSVLVVVPGAGDDVQAQKAGVMEIADVFVVNKSDREGADRLVAQLEGQLALQSDADGTPRPPIVQTVATTGRGIVEALDAIDRAKRRSGGAPTDRRQRRDEALLRSLVSQRLMARLEGERLAPGELSTVAGRIAAREIDPYTAADALVARAWTARDR